MSPRAGRRACPGLDPGAAALLAKRAWVSLAHAVPVPGFHPDFPAADAGGLLCHGAAASVAGMGAAGGLAGLLQLVGPAFPADPAGTVDGHVGCRRALSAHGPRGLADGRDCRQLRLARLLQVYGLSRRLSRGAGRREGAADLHRAADRHLVLHLPARLLPGRRGPRRRALLSLAARHPVRLAVPASDRRADRAPPPDHAPARRRPAAPRVARALRQGAGILHHRLRQEGVPRRPDGALRRSRLRGGRDLDAVARRRLARRARLLVPAVPRLLRLQRDGDRAGADARRALPRQLRHALSRQRPRRVSGGAGTSRCRS